MVTDMTSVKTYSSGMTKSDPATAAFEERAKNLLKAELKRKGLSYKHLAEMLANIGVTETEQNINKKISRGGFTAAFFLQCMEAIGVDDLRLK